MALFSTGGAHMHLRDTWKIFMLAWAVLFAAGRSSGGALESPCEGQSFERFDIPPAVMDTAYAEYPEIAATARIEGTVSVAVSIAADGSFFGASIVRAVHPLLDRRALNAARSCTYAPATSGGVAVPGMVLIEYEFNAAREVMRKRAEWEGRRRWPAPLVSEVAECRSTGRTGLWETGVYVYEGIVVEGNMSVEALRVILDQCQDRAAVGERPVSVYNYTAFYPEFRPNPETCGDIVVNTRHKWSDSGECVTTGVHRFRISEDRIECMSSEVWSE
jgi:TonB family protein